MARMRAALCHHWYKPGSGTIFTATFLSLEEWLAEHNTTPTAWWIRVKLTLAEFFAVAANLLWNQPTMMKKQMPEIYRLLCQFIDKNRLRFLRVTNPNRRSAQECHPVACINITESVHEFSDTRVAPYFQLETKCMLVLALVPSTS